MADISPADLIAIYNAVHPPDSYFYWINFSLVGAEAVAYHEIKLWFPTLTENLGKWKKFSGTQCAYVNTVPMTEEDAKLARRVMKAVCHVVHGGGSTVVLSKALEWKDDVDQATVDFIRGEMKKRAVTRGRPRNLEDVFKELTLEDTGSEENK
eukprot:TRINITY_DN81092_c0_g1_i1.p2 TRINITY_DN81092_c0_g1~~TRINITY_DN81092_c0_g1_i1.p2  ORF type:complete len:153 (+),score=34.19 TRINITY_DN81092_c0_g1_i1:90-548(+)